MVHRPKTSGNICQQGAPRKDWPFLGLPPSLRWQLLPGLQVLLAGHTWSRHNIDSKAWESNGRASDAPILPRLTATCRSSSLECCADCDPAMLVRRSGATAKEGDRSFFQGPTLSKTPALPRWFLSPVLLHSGAVVVREGSLIARSKAPWPSTARRKQDEWVGLLAG